MAGKGMRRACSGFHRFTSQAVSCTMKAHEHSTAIGQGTKSRDHLRCPQFLSAIRRAEIANGHRGAEAIAKAVSAWTRSIRILCDYLVLSGFLSKDRDQYSLSTNLRAAMRKIVVPLASGGRCVTLDFVPNGDRLSPPTPAAFVMMMLGTTPAGDVYTYAEYDTMFRNAGFAFYEIHSLTRAPQELVISRKA